MLPNKGAMGNKGNPFPSAPPFGAPAPASSLGDDEDSDDEQQGMPGPGPAGPQAGRNANPMGPGFGATPGAMGPSGFNQMPGGMGMPGPMRPLMNGFQRPPMHPMLSHPMLSHPMLSHPMLSHPMLSHPMLSHPMLSQAGHAAAMGHLHQMNQAAGGPLAGSRDPRDAIRNIREAGMAEGARALENDPMLPMLRQAAAQGDPHAAYQVARMDHMLENMRKGAGPRG